MNHLLMLTTEICGTSKVIVFFFLVGTERGRDAAEDVGNELFSLPGTEFNFPAQVTFFIMYMYN